MNTEFEALVAKGLAGTLTMDEALGARWNKEQRALLLSYFGNAITPSVQAELDALDLAKLNILTDANQIVDGGKYVYMGDALVSGIIPNNVDITNIVKVANLSPNNLTLLDESSTNVIVVAPLSYAEFSMTDVGAGAFDFVVGINASITDNASLGVNTLYGTSGGGDLYIGSLLNMMGNAITNAGDLDAANGTFTDVDVNGTLTASEPIVSTGTPSSDSHVLNRGQLEDEYLFEKGYQLTSMDGSNSGSGSTSVVTGYLRLLSNSNGVGNAIATVRYLATRQASGASSRLSRDFCLALDINIGTLGVTNTEASLRIVFGATSTSQTTLGTTAGWEIAVDNTGIWGAVCDGTTREVSTPVSLPIATAENRRVRIVAEWIASTETLNVYASSATNNNTIDRPTLKFSITYSGTMPVGAAGDYTNIAQIVSSSPGYSLSWGIRNVKVIES